MKEKIPDEVLAAFGEKKPDVPDDVLVAFGVKKKVTDQEKHLGLPLPDSFKGVPVSSPIQSPLNVKEKPEAIEDYNKRFEEVTGHKDFSLSEPVKPKGLLGQDAYEKRKKSFEEKKYLTNREREKEIIGVQDKVYTGTVKPEELSQLYEKPYGKKLVQETINGHSPETGGYGLSQQVLGHDKKWDEAAKAINIKNRPQGVEAQNQYFYNLDNEVANDLDNYLSAREETVVAGRGSVKEIIKTPFGKIDTNNPKELATVLSSLENSDFVTDKEGKRVDGGREKLIKQINEKLMYITSQKEVHPEITALSGKTKEAILRVNMKRERGEKIAPLTDEVNQKQFELGLNYLKDAKPNIYTNVIRAINDNGEIAGLDYESISKVGQSIYNQQVFSGGASDPNLIGAETNIDYTSYDSKKAEYARIIGERAKKAGGKNRREFTRDEIKKLGADLPNQEIVNDLADEEQIIGYDAIAKSGWRESVAQGVLQPFAGIKSTLQIIGESPAETYLRSRKLDTGIGGQKVADEKGNYSSILPSDRKNVLYDIARGFGQFIPQVLLAKGLGGGATGTFISTTAQTFGDSYADALQKTGDPKTAALMGGIDALSSAAFESFILPDVKIADDIVRGFSKKLSTGLTDLIKNGGDPATLAMAGRSYVRKAVTGFLDISGKEISEEVGTQIADYITESVFSPATAKDRDLADEVMDTVSGTFISMLAPALLGGGGAAMNKDFTRDGLNAAAINFEDSMNAISKALSENSITQLEYDKSAALLNLHKDSIQNAPKTDAKGDLLSLEEKMNYAYQDTLSKVYADDKNNTADEAEQEVLQKKIADADENKKNILGGEKITPELIEQPIRTPEGIATPIKEKGPAIILPEENKVAENIPLKKINEEVTTLEAERDQKIAEANKPELPELKLPTEEIKNSKLSSFEMEEVGRKHNDILIQADRLRKIIDCLWKTA